VISPTQRPLPEITQTFTRDKHPCSGGIRTHDPSTHSAESPRLRPRGHWNWQWIGTGMGFSVSTLLSLCQLLFHQRCILMFHSSTIDAVWFGHWDPCYINWKTKVYLFNVHHIQQTLKLFCKRLVPALASSHQQALSTGKDTENFTTAIFKEGISSLH
jgi:hypothetical protein